MKPRVWSWQKRLDGSPGELPRLLKENQRIAAIVERCYRLRFKAAP